eukprot:maker-scaffold_19-augustus-gene-4.31-mRNA-1 protein AED:0.03 eAED:0.04 QI:0/0/0/1/0/0/2/0/816
MEEIKRKLININQDHIVDICSWPAHTMLWLSSSSLKAGYLAIARSEVAAVTLAGGQGTRLGFHAPKGTFPVSNFTNKTLFQLQAERLSILFSQAQEKTNFQGTKLSWYILTNELNHKETQNFFIKNKFFHLENLHVIFFKQTMLPCFDLQGKYILSSKSTLAMAPNGNGGLFSSIASCPEILQDIKEKHVTHLNVVSIDNSLVQPLDPFFVGLCISENSSVGNVSVPKKYWNEAVGVLGKKDGKISVVEYTELSQLCEGEVTEESVKDFGSANICNHMFGTEFLVGEVFGWVEKGYHLAKKKVPFYSKAIDKVVEPEEKNGVKLELFVFDVFEKCKVENFALMERRREEIFSPIKNASGKGVDSTLETARKDLSCLALKWLIDAGARLAQEDIEVELSPLLSVDGSGLQWAKELCFSGNSCILSSIEKQRVDLPGERKVLETTSIAVSNGWAYLFSFTISVKKKMLMSKKELESICLQSKQYRTPRLNDMLYLHYKGFSKIENLDEYIEVKVLWLEGNGFLKIEGLEKCIKLRTLYLQENCLEKIENINHLKFLDTLNLTKNFISSLNGLRGLDNLKSLLIGHNRLKNTEDIQELIHLPNLGSVNLENNRLEEASVLEVLKQCKNLCVVYLKGNPCTRKIENYRRNLIYSVNKLTYLDTMPVFPEERRKAVAFMSAFYSSNRDVKTAVKAESAERSKIFREKEERDKENRECLNRMIANGTKIHRQHKKHSHVVQEIKQMSEISPYSGDPVIDIPENPFLEEHRRSIIDNMLDLTMKDYNMRNTQETTKGKGNIETSQEPVAASTTAPAPPSAIAH